MADQTNTDIAVLRTEITQLRADFAKIAGTMRDIATNGVAGAGQQMQISSEKVWTELKRQAGNAGREIEERPIAAALVALGAGVLLGLLHHRRRLPPPDETGNMANPGASPPLPDGCGGVPRRAEDLN